jgi:hypothetical protein
MIDQTVSIRPVVCWHHGDEKRLRQCLDLKYCDLYHPLDESCLKWWKKLRLEVGSTVRFCVKGNVVAFGIIKSEPYDLASIKQIEPVDPKWPGAVDIEEIPWHGKESCDSIPQFGSHRL